MFYSETFIDFITQPLRLLIVACAFVIMSFYLLIGLQAAYLL